MIEEVLPSTAVAVEAHREEMRATLFPTERAALGRAVEKRRREFTTGRACARLALERLGRPAGPVPAGKRGEPRWPAGVVGSITHCVDYRACAVAEATDLIAIGIDAEPNRPLPAGLLADIARPEEAELLRVLSRVEPGVHWDRLLFSAKEAVYKAWFPLTGRQLDFDDAALVIDPGGRRFQARLLAPAPAAGAGQPLRLPGRWLARDELLISAIAVGPGGAAPADS